MFERLENNGLSINQKKCVFGRKELNFLGYRVNGSGREVATNPKLGGLRGYPPKSGGATGKIVGLTTKKVGGLKAPPVATSLPTSALNLVNTTVFLGMAFPT